MWEISAIALFLSFVRFPGVSGECKLDTAMYMPFLTRVVDFSPNEPPNMAGKGLTVATGNIITPNSVLTSCTPIKYTQPKNLECQAMQAHYSDNGKIDEDHFKTVDFQEDKKGCIEKRKVKTIHLHKDCPSADGDWDGKWGNEATRFNVAILTVTQVFLNYTESVPAMPFLPDIATQLSMINTFNTLRTERCEIPLYHGVEPKVWFEKDLAVRSIPLQRDCKSFLCKGARKECNETVQNDIGYVLCARRVVQKTGGINWNDHLLEDKDLHKPGENNCKDIHHILGAPLMCRGVALGIVTSCQNFGIVVSTIYTLRVFIHRAIEAGYTEEVVYMDTSDIPTEKSVSDKARSSLFQEEIRGRQPEFTYSNSNAVHQQLLHAGLAVLAIHFFISFTNKFIHK